MGRKKQGRGADDRRNRRRVGRCPRCNGDGYLLAGRNWRRPMCQLCKGRGKTQQK